MRKFTCFRCILYSLLILVCLTMSSAILLKQQHPIDRAKILHYKGVNYFNVGNSKKALKYFRRANRLHSCNEYVLEIANLYMIEGNFKSAYNKLGSLQPEANATPLDKVNTVLWQTYFGLQHLGLRSQSLGGYKHALELYDHYHDEIDSLELRSQILNNIAVCRLYNQTAFSEGQKPTPTHKRDYFQALGALNNAVRIDSTNCIALYNKMLIESVLAIDSVHWRYRNVPYGQIEQLAIPSYEDFCNIAPPPPPPKPHLAITNKLAESTEVIILMDTSGSMDDKVSPDSTRIELAKDLAIKSCNDVPESVGMGLITFGGDCVPPSIDFAPGKLSRDILAVQVNNLEVGGGTPLNISLQHAASRFTPNAESKTIFLFTDGLNTCSDGSTCELAEQLRKQGITVHAFAPLLADSHSEVFAIADCLSATTGGELLSLTEDAELEIVEQSPIPQYLHPLVLRKADLAKATYTPIQNYTQDLSIPKNAE